MPIGLDGRFRFAEGEEGLPEAMRGYWADDGRFALEYDTIAHNHHFFLWLRFEGDTVTVEVKETARADEGVVVEGRAE
jgi:hypothetical protein